METNEVSIHQVKVYLAVKALDGWSSSSDLAEASGVNPRTMRAHLLKLVNLGIVEQAEVFPGHRYRLAAKGSKRNGGYLRRLLEAQLVFGL